MQFNATRAIRRSVRILNFTLVATVGSVMIHSDASESRPATSEENPGAQARANDVASIDAILAALYDTISGPAGPRDWDRLRSLFLPGARLIPCRKLPNSSVSEASTLTVEEFIKRVEPNTKKQGFFEREIHRRLDRFGATAQVFSTYESRHAATDARPFVRGINSIQLFFDGKRWWVVTIYWDSERSDQPIPVEYLPKA